MMILNNKWFPYSTNGRSLRWERNDYQLPLLDAVAMMLLLGLSPAFCLISALAGIDPTRNIISAVGCVLTFLLFERLIPVQKYTGVPLDGLRLVFLEMYLDRPLEELAANRDTHRLVDSYITNEYIRFAALEVEQYRRGLRQSSASFERSLQNLHRAASSVAWEIRRWYAETETVPIK